MAGVYTTSVNEATLDEALMAYKSLTDIIDVISESVDVIEVLKPICLVVLAAVFGVTQDDIIIFQRDVRQDWISA